MFDIGHGTHNSPGGKPLSKSPLLYIFRGFPFASLALECHGAASYTPDNVRRSALREDAPMDINCLGPWYGIEVAEYRLDHPRVFQSLIPVRHT